MKFKPSQKAHRRYLLLEGITKEQVKEIIHNGIGLIGWSQADPIIIQDSPLVLAVSRSSLDLIKASFALSPLQIKLRKVSGTLKGLGIKDKPVKSSG